MKIIAIKNGVRYEVLTMNLNYPKDGPTQQMSVRNEGRQHGDGGIIDHSAKVEDYEFEIEGYTKNS